MARTCEDNAFTKCIKTLHPQTLEEKKLCLEQWCIAARSIDSFPISPIFGALAVMVALPWVPWQRLVLWYVFLLATTALFIPIRKRIAAIPKSLENLNAIRNRLLAAELPVQVLWLLIVPISWQAGNLANNCYLMLFLFGSYTVALSLYGPCLQLSLPVTLLYLPVMLFFPIQTGTYMDLVVTITQVTYLGILVMFVCHHTEIFNETVCQRLTIEAMAADLAKARSDAELANKAKSAFLASMSHELRTPMNAIIGFSDIINQEVFGPVDPPRYGEYVKDIGASGQHLLGLINDVLDLSKIEAGKRELSDRPIDLGPLLYDTVRFLEPQAKKYSVEIEVLCDTQRLLVADERAIRQILINFLSNAIKFSASGKSVQLFAERAVRNGAEILCLGVVDQGLGMDSEGIKKALEPYGQVNPHAARETMGTGLGLPIAKALIEAHGARFCIESQIGQGTRIWGEFPASRLQNFA